MSTTIQSIPTIFTDSPPIALQPISNLAQRIESLLSVPGVIVSLGATPTETLTYNAAGLFGSQLPEADSIPKVLHPTTSTVANVASDTSSIPAVGNTRDTSAEAIALSNNFPLNSNAQSLATLTANPAYAIAVAGFHMSMANSRLDLALAAARPSLPDSIEPVIAIAAIKPIQHTMGDR